MKKDKYDVARMFGKALVVFEKFGTITARPAVEGEVISTVINGVTETTNTAKAGDIIATGVKGESWIIPGEKFPKLYKASAEDENQFDPIGRVVGVRSEEDFTFTAPWGEAMICQKGDYIVTSEADDFNPTKAYRIEAGAFVKTYRKVLEVPLVEARCGDDVMEFLLRAGSAAKDLGIEIMAEFNYSRFLIKDRESARSAYNSWKAGRCW